MLLTTCFWGVWGALSELPEKKGFPATLGYVVWAITMVIPALVALKIIGWKVEKHPKVIWHGVLAGFTGSAGQLILFQALKQGPAYMVFPIVSLSPIVTIFLSLILLKEKATGRTWAGIIMALVALPLLAYQSPDEDGRHGSWWIPLSLLVFIFWGVQAYILRIANTHARAESIFFYMTCSSLSLIPIALFFTDFSRDINWGIEGLYMTAGIQVLNSIGVLFLTYAFRFGKAIVVSPFVNTGAPVITVILSLLIYGVFPHLVIIIGMVLAVMAIFILNE
jgi:drug/metabolite transporter (DMT)-like permease